MRIRLRIVALAAGLCLGGAVQAEMGAFDAERLSDVREAKILLPIVADLSGLVETTDSQGAALDRSEPAGEAEGGVTAAALGRPEPAKSESSEVAVALPPEADRLSVDVASAVAVDADVPTQILDEITGSVVAGETGTEPSPSSDETLVASIATEEGVLAPVEQGFVPSEPAEAPANSSELGAGP
jgi:hypothetical protein